MVKCLVECRDYSKYVKGLNSVQNGRAWGVEGGLAHFFIGEKRDGLLQ